MSTNKKNPKNKKNNKNTKNKNDVQYKNIYIGLSSEDDKKQNHHKTTMKKNKQNKKNKQDTPIQNNKNEIHFHNENHVEKDKQLVKINNKKNNSMIKIKKEKNSNVISLNRNFDSKNLIYTPKLRNTFIVIIVIFILLIGRIGYLQFVDGAYLTEMAYQQQAINQILSPKRGNIYDSTGKALAISAQVDTITINPDRIVGDTDAETKTLKETVAKGLSDIFALDYNETLEKVNSSSKVETIIKKVEQEKVDELEAWMDENDISVGINIDEDTKRYYPYGDLASSVIGFCGSDNQGLSGIESKWDSVLTGTPGKIVSAKDSSQKEIPNAEETYISAENGSNITLTLDLNIQSTIEKYLEQAVEKYECEDGGNVIVMNPQTGDILGMACYPDYDLNSPYTPNSTLAKIYDSLSDEEKNEALYKMWSNKSVSESYEPGSTFKIITSSVALEEGITTPDRLVISTVQDLKLLKIEKLNAGTGVIHMVLKP